MNRGSRSKTSPKVAQELWERLTEKPARHDREYLPWYLKHFIEPWLLTSVFAICCVAILIMGLASALHILMPGNSQTTTRYIIIAAQRVIITVYIGIGAYSFPILIRSYFENKPKTIPNRFLSVSAQSVAAIACFIGWLILTDVIHLSDETQTIIALALFAGTSFVYIIHTILKKRVPQQNIGRFLLIITAFITSVLALIHLWQ
jgi:hypothetical protein